MVTVDHEIKAMLAVEQYQLDAARFWVFAHTPRFQTIIQQLTDITVRKALLLHDEATIAQVCRLNPFTRDFGNGVVHLFPDSDLAPNMTKNSNHTLLLPKDGTHIPHINSDFRLGRVHIDVTFGKHFPDDFNTVIGRYPWLFVGHILVATESDITSVYGATYTGGTIGPG